jgi:hypothetical protein
MSYGGGNRGNHAWSLGAGRGKRIRTLGRGSSRQQPNHSVISPVVSGDKTGDNTPLF